MTDDTYSIGAASKLFFAPSSWWSQAAFSEKPLFLCYNNAPALWVLVLLSLLLLLPPLSSPPLFQFLPLRRLLELTFLIGT